MMGDWLTECRSVEDVGICCKARHSDWTPSGRSQPQGALSYWSALLSGLEYLSISMVLILNTFSDACYFLVDTLPLLSGSGGGVVMPSRYQGLCFILSFSQWI